MSDDRRHCNIALVGSKFMGKAHSNAYLKVGKFFDLPVQPIMHTAAARDPQETAAFAERWGWANASTDWKAAVRNPDVHLVDIGTPNHLHEPIALAALKEGKHVACEKPLASSLDTARRMRDAANEAAGKGAKTFVWFSYRGMPALALARRFVREGKIGRIYHVRANYLQSWAAPDLPLNWRFDAEASGSGALGDIAAHIVDAARFITGEEITEVSGAVEETFIKERAVPDVPGKTGPVTVDDAVSFLTRLSGGAIASFEATRLATGNHNANRIEINGENGSLRWDFENANILWYYNAADDPDRAGWQRIMCTQADHHPFFHAWWPDGHILGYEHGFINLASAMFHAIAGQDMETPMPDFEDAYQTQRVLEAATHSARQRGPVNLDEIK